MSMIKFPTLALLVPLALAAPAWADPGLGGRMGLLQMDRDGDGAITRDEMQAGPAGMFAAADTDGDGRVSRAPNCLPPPRSAPKPGSTGCLRKPTATGMVRSARPRSTRCKTPAAPPGWTGCSIALTPTRMAA